VTAGKRLFNNISRASFKCGEVACGDAENVCPEKRWIGHDAGGSALTRGIVCENIAVLRKRLLVVCPDISEDCRRIFVLANESFSGSRPVKR
jgi:hypothetical protein